MPDEDGGAPGENRWRNPPHGYGPQPGHYPQAPSQGPPQAFFQPQGFPPQGFPPPGPPAGPPRRTGLIIGVAVGAVLVLAAAAIVVAVSLGHRSHPAAAAAPAASRIPSARPTSTTAAEPRYTRVPTPCGLVTPATLAAYVPGGSTEGGPIISSLGTITTDSCDWRSQTPTEIRVIDLTVTLDTFTGVSNENDYTGKLAAAEQPFDGTGITGEQQVGDLGDQATIIYKSMAGGGTEADLFVRSGNAIINITYICNARSGGRQQSRAKELAGSEAAARNVLTALPT